MGYCRHCGRTGRHYPRNEPHGYVPWFGWAEKKGRTHEQHPCPGCGRLSVWKTKVAALAPAHKADCLTINRDDQCPVGGFCARIGSSRGRCIKCGRLPAHREVSP